MAAKLTASQFHAQTDLPDWRFVLGRIEALFNAPGFQSAAGFVTDVASAAEAAGHHPDIDLRYPGRVHVALTTHAAHGLTERDAQLARTISDLAATAGLTSEPQTALGVEIAIDAI